MMSSFFPTPLFFVADVSCRSDGRVRLATLELSCLLLKQSVLSGAQCIIKDVHLACLEVRARPTHSNRKWPPRDYRITHTTRG